MEFWLLVLRSDLRSDLTLGAPWWVDPPVCARVCGVFRAGRSEERRGGEECSSRWEPIRYKKHPGGGSPQFAQGFALFSDLAEASRSICCSHVLIYDPR